MNSVVDDEKTIVNFKPEVSSASSNPAGFDRPMPGGRRGNSASVDSLGHTGTLPGVSVASLSPPAPSVSARPANIAVGVFKNPSSPLVAIAQPLLNEISDLNQTAEQRNFVQYRSQISEELSKFEMFCNQLEISEEHLIYSRYALCTAIDEMVNKSPWSAKGEWSKNSLLAQYHGETDGGEKFYELLDHLIVHPAKHLLVLELMFLIMNLGFEGKYHLQPKGYIELEKIKDNLYQTIRLQKGEPEAALSLNWKGVVDRRNPLMRIVPAWVFVAVTGLILVSMYSGFSYLAEEAGDKTASKISQLKTSIEASKIDTAEGVTNE